MRALHLGTFALLLFVATSCEKTITGPLVTVDYASATNLLSRNKTVTVSGTEGSYWSNFAVDGNTESRWASGTNWPEWIKVDLGASTWISNVIVRYEAAANNYFYSVSTDNVTWTVVYTNAGTPGTFAVTTNGIGRTARYFRIQSAGTSGSAGFSILELDLLGI